MKARLLLPTAYATLFATALLWMLAYAKQTPLAGIFALLLTLPWSVLVIRLLTAIVPGLFDASLLPGTLVLAAAACVNASLLFLAGAKIDARRAR